MWHDHGTHCETKMDLCYPQTVCTHSANFKLVGMKYAKDINALEQRNTVFLRARRSTGKSFWEQSFYEEVESCH